MKLTNKRAVVTGAASGIGKAIALSFAREGADVVVLDINAEKSADVVSAIQAIGRKSLAIACDVSYADQVARSFEAAEAFLGGLDILVNNTGVIRFSKIVDIRDGWLAAIRRILQGVISDGLLH